MATFGSFLSSSTLTKDTVGLGNVDNTADADKPVSTAQQTALNLKGNLSSPAFTGTVSGITAAMVGAPSGSGSSSGTNTGDQTLAGLGGVPTSRTITINGTAQDLSADRAWTVTAALPDLIVTAMGPSANQTIATGFACYTPSKYEIVNTFFLEIASGAIMEIG